MNKLAPLLERERPPVAAIASEPVLRRPKTEVVELRADLYQDMQKEYQLRMQLAHEAMRDMATIYTLREQAEGGKWHGSEEKKLLRFSFAMKHVDAIDVEGTVGRLLSDTVAIVKATSDETLVIGSYHDFDGTPEMSFLIDLYHQMEGEGADFVKFATTVNTTADFNVMVDFTEEVAPDGGLITVGMGVHGPQLRELLPVLGSRLCYAPIGDAVVPGQLSIFQMNESLDTSFPED